MHRTIAATVPVAVTLAVLLAGCGSGSTAPPPAASSSAVTTTSAATSSSGGASAIATWAASFCSAFIPLGTALKSVNLKPDTSTPAVAVSSLSTLYKAIADAYGTAATGLRKAGPPPVGSISGSVDAISTVATTFQALATATAAVDITDVAAVSALVQGATAPLENMSSAIKGIDKDLPPEVISVLNVTPECNPPA